MRSVCCFIALVFTSVLFYQCQKEISYPGSSNADPGEIVLPTPLKANLQGNVLDENGKPATNVDITVGSKVTTTDTKGYFRINDASLDKNAALVIAEKAGYFTAYRSFSATTGTNQVVIKLVKKNLGGTVNGANGGDVFLSNGTKISLPANGIVKKSGNSNYTGTVNVYADYIDPTSTDILERLPGSFMADDKDGKRVLLSSYGMMVVELESSTGEKLQIKPGNTATLTSPIPSSLQSSAPATIPLWYIDESTGLWKEQGTAAKKGSNYVGTVKHFTYWNCDVFVPTVSLTATFKTAKGQPLVNALVVFKQTGGSYPGSTYGYTDSLGQLNGPIAADMNLLLRVVDECGTEVYEKSVGPYRKTTDLGIVTVPSQTGSLVTIQGNLANCFGKPVTNGYAIISIENWVRYAKVDNNGRFSTNFLLCNANSSVQILGVDEAKQQQRNIILAKATSPTTDIGNVLVCGNTSEQYINYRIDSSSYLITDADSLTAYYDNLHWLNVVSGLQPGSGNKMLFTFGGYPNDVNVNPNYGVASLWIQNYMYWSIVRPLSVSMPSFPNAVGDFYEGNFKGQFIDLSTNLTHDVICFFKVRRHKAPWEK